MSSVEQLRVVATADIGNFERGMGRVADTLKQTASAATAAPGPLNATSTAARNAAESLNKVKSSSSGATQSMINLGRVVQDAPYGFIGVANNINPLLESFQRLKAETGSTKQAFSALAGSLLGAGGLGLAVSIATSLLTVFAMQGLKGSGDAAKDAGDKVKTYKEEIQEVAKSLSKEATEVTGFIAILKSETETRQRKLEAIKELQKIQPEIFKNLKLEGDAVRGLDEAYTAYIANMKNIVAAKLIQIKIEAKLAEVIELQGEATGKLSKEAQAARDKFKDFTKAQTDGLDPLTRANKALLEAKYNAMGFLSEAAKAGKLRTLNDEIKGLVERLSEFSSTIKTDTIKPDELKVAPKALRISAENGLEVFFDDPEAAAKALSDAIEKTIPKGIKFGTSVFGQIDKESLNIIGDKEAEIMRQNMISKLHKAGISTTEREVGNGLKIRIPIEIATADELAAAEKRIKDFGQVLQGTIDQIGPALSSAFSAAAKGGNFFGDLFSSLLKSLGAGLTQLGLQVIAASELILAAKAAIKAGGVSGIGAGIALVALGAIISAAASRIKGASFATGVRGFEGGVATVGERGPERVFLPAGASVQPNNEMMAYSGVGSGERLIAEVSGESLRFILTRADKRMASSYGL